MKSVFVIIQFPKPGYKAPTRVIGVAETEDLAMKHMNDCKTLFGSEMYGYRFDEFALITDDF